MGRGGGGAQSLSLINLNCFRTFLVLLCDLLIQMGIGGGGGSSRPPRPQSPLPTALPGYFNIFLLQSSSFDQDFLDKLTRLC